MRALVFDLSIPKYLAAKALGPKRRWAHLGPAGCTSLREVPAPSAPDASWATLAPSKVGLCGTDLATIFFKLSPALSALNDFPATLGHEVLARVVKEPATARDALGAPIGEGSRVVVDPFVSCAARGVEEAQACRSCREGFYQTCERAGLGPRRGQLLGAGRELPGGFAERSIAHQSQLFSIEGRIDDDRVGALVEPLAVAVQAVSTHAPREGRALVLGAGPIGLATVWALSHYCPRVEVTVVSLEQYQLDHASRLGAHQTLLPDARRSLVEELATLARSPLLRPMLGAPFLAGGFDAVYECVGQSSTLEDAFRVCRPRGTVVTLGCQSVVRQIDLTFVWARELRVQGTLAYGWCPDPSGRRRRAFDVTIELAGRDQVLLAPLVTHEFPLDRASDAIDAAVDRRAHRSVKVLINPQAHDAHGSPSTQSPLR
jgi:L-iditol 2-dehydrogenase